MNESKLEKYKQLLIKERSNILRELELEREHYIYNEQGDMVDVADSQVSNSVIKAISNIDHEKLREVESALEKIKNGNYGVCESSGKKIPEIRLNHIPWVRYTIEYAQKLEREKRSSAV